jgi:hypothetical protein
MMRFIYFGEELHNDSEGFVGRLLNEDTFIRAEWPDVYTALFNGQIVQVRPATATEMEWVISKWLSIKAIQDANVQSALI